jgi:nitrite reductase (NO-forming)
MAARTTIASTTTTIRSTPASGSSDTNDATIDFNASPGPAFTARDPNAPAPLSGTVHDLTIEASENVLEVAPGVTQQMWTFNLAGQPPTVPGPILRGKIGDTFRV